MRRDTDEFDTIITKLDLALVLEEQLDCKFSDEELETVATLAEMATLVEPRLLGAAGPTAPAEHLVRAAVRNLQNDPQCRIFPAREDDLDMNVPILDAVDPDRWERNNHYS